MREPYSIGGRKTWSEFQYSSRVEVLGISGHVDPDYFREDHFLTDQEQKHAKQIRHDYSSDNDGCCCYEEQQK